MGSEYTPGISVAGETRARAPKELLGISRARPPELPGQMKVLAQHLPERKTPLSVTQRLFQEKRVTPNRKAARETVTWAGRKREVVRVVVGSWGPEVNNERIQAEPFL